MRTIIPFGEFDLSEELYYNHKDAAFTMGTFAASNTVYDKDEVNRWYAKYNINDDSTVCWVSLDRRPRKVKGDAHRINDVPENDLTKAVFTDKDGIIIGESDDGDGNFLFVLNDKTLF